MGEVEAFTIGKCEEAVNGATEALKKVSLMKTQ